MPNDQFVVHAFHIQETGDTVMWRDGEWRDNEWRNGEWSVSGDDALGFADMLSRPAMLQNRLILSDPPTLAWRMPASLSDVVEAVRNHAREKGVTITWSSSTWTIIPGGFPGWSVESNER